MGSSPSPPPLGITGMTEVILRPQGCRPPAPRRPCWLGKGWGRGGRRASQSSVCGGPAGPALSGGLTRLCTWNSAPAAMHQG